MTTKVYAEICIQNYKHGKYVEVRLIFLLKKDIQIEIDDYSIGTMFSMVGVVSKLFLHLQSTELSLMA